MEAPKNEVDILFASLKGGDEEAFTRIYDQYWESLYAIGYNRLKSTSDVEDIIQELFTEIWRNRATINVRESLKVYLFTAMKYRVIDHIRKRKSTYQSIEEDTGSNLSTNSTEQILSFNELYDQLRVSIDQLPERCRLIFKMSREMNMSSAEIADELKLSKRTVETQIYKSLKHLRKDLSDYPSLILILSAFLADF